MPIGKMIHRSFPNLKEDLLDVLVLGNSKVKMVLSNGNLANRLFDKQLFNKNDLIAHIPNYLLNRKRIIFDEHTEHTEDDIKS